MTAATAYWVRITNVIGMADSQAAFVRIVEAPQLSITDRSASAIVIQARALDGTRWQVEQSADLKQWQKLSDGMLPATVQSGAVNVQVPVMSAAQQFYRVVWVS